MPIEIKTAKQDRSMPWKDWLSYDLSLTKKKFKVKQRTLFSERLALLLETGVPLHTSLEILHQQEEIPHVKDLLKKLLIDVSAGESFSNAISKHPESFSTNYVNLIAASEKGGFMSKILEQLVIMDNKSEDLRSNIRSALIYPSFLIASSVGVLIFMLAYVFPKFTELFSSIRDQLPITTIMFMVMSDIIRQYWMIITGTTAILLSLFIKWITMAKNKEFIDRQKLQIPILKNIFIQSYMVQILRVMGLSLSNGVTIIDTLNSCHDIVKNSVIRKFIANVRDQVTQGQGLSTGFKESAFIPPMLASMIGTGEAAGNLPTVMQRVATHYEAELAKRLENFTQVLGPVVILIMGGFIGVIVISLILPIFKLSKAVA